MKILHTADWHIGKQLHKYPLEEDHRLFLDWLGDLIEERRIDLLLVAGDVFDTAFPSSAALTLYYRFLQRLIGCRCRVVITGGNHDSPGVLNAPREILRHMDVRIVGCATDDCADSLLIFDDLNLAIAAVPYLRDVDLRRSVSGQSYDDRSEAIRQGIRQHYQRHLDLHQAQYRGLTLFGMGHLYVQGATVSDSEREIHAVGGLAAFSCDHFPEGFDYLALGHIHKPQKLSERVRYSGSPLPLSFSERHDPKYLLELTLESDKPVQVEVLPTPRLRELRTFTGSLDEVWESLQAFQAQGTLEALLELNVVEPTFDPQKSVRFDLLLREFEKADFRIIKPRLTFENRLKEADELFSVGTDIEDLTPREVFLRRLAAEQLDEPTQALLLEAFEELLTEVDEAHSFPPQT
ncbi:exonuclease SbcCD subunit D C-terminal domain-containing protein [Rhabdobacter roseus]|uniref:Nuclease SbcCD subunit D n=1 Tax=Rhabdobacter roseus TaxID=1655419 RepID=A0A840TLG9_9BACT|nr:exonuclease SbcCD subunit D C-terminal domain-containing protein [Rhabdobacter roseus]MBB5285056.1 exonuclease SbcD [Rhabdobacter roseus]